MKKRIFKKSMAFILTLALMAGLMPMVTPWARATAVNLSSFGGINNTSSTSDSITDANGIKLTVFDETNSAPYSNYMPSDLGLYIAGYMGEPSTSEVDTTVEYATPSPFSVTSLELAPYSNTSDISVYGLDMNGNQIGMGITLPSVLAKDKQTLDLSSDAQFSGIYKLKIVSVNSDFMIYGLDMVAATPSPTVTTISPANGPATGGTSVTITGTNFTSGSTVTIGGTAATGVTVVDDTTITVTTPAGTAGNADVTVTTSGGTGTKAGAFTYTNGNAAPTDISLSATSIDENAAAGTTVGALSTTDPDEGNTFTYSLVAGDGDADNSAFTISGSSLRMTNSPDFETKSSYSVRIRATDQGELYCEEPFTITVNNLNESPTDISLSATSIDENAAAGTTVGALNTTDPDAGNTFTYSLVAGDGDADNSAFTISGSSLRMTNSPDFETKSSYSVRIRATDQGELYCEEPFTITVSDVNDAPVVTAPGSITVAEDVTSALLGISFADADAGSSSVTATFAVDSGILSATSGDGVTVGGSPSSLTLTGSVSAINNFMAVNNVIFTTASNQTSSITLTVSINDGGNTGAGGVKNDSKTITLVVSPVNDAPLVTAPASITVTEDVASALTGISFADVDAGSSSVTAILAVNSGILSATSGGGVIVGGSPSSLTLSGSIADINTFIAGNNVIFTNASDQTSNVTLTVSINDGGNAGVGGTKSDSKTVMIAVSAVNDAPAVTTSGGSAAFNKPVGVPATPVVIDNAITVSDPDNSTLVSATVSITGHSSGDVLAFTNDGSTMGNIVATYNAGTGVMTLNSSGGTATVAQWQAALRSVTYTSISTTPYASTRIISFEVNDGTLTSLAATKPVVVSNVATVPGAPTSVLATAGDGSVTINIIEPASNGGSPIIGYEVSSTPGGHGGTVVGNSITVTGLTNGTSYVFTVVARNSVGTGTPTTSNSVTPKGPQTIAFANPGPQNFGTTPTLSASASSGLAVTFTSDDTDVCTVTSGGVLTFLKTGTARITAHQAGNSAYLQASDVTQAFSVNAAAPGTPVIGAATADKNSATVSFTAPTFTGGASITGYIVTSSGGQTATGTASPITVTGLTGGTAYTFTVRAINSAGAGNASAASNSVTPFANSTISPTTAAFDKKTSAQADIPVTMTLNGNTLTGIQNGTTTLTQGTDYTVSGSTVTLLKSYLAARATGGNVVLTFNFNRGNAQTLTISVSDTTSSGGSSGGGSSTTTAPSAGAGAPVIVNGETQTAGTAATTTQNGQTNTTVTVDAAKLASILEAKGDHATVSVPVTTGSDVASAALTGQMVKNMEAKDVILEIKTGSAAYTLPASQINIDEVSKQLGQNVTLSDIKVEIQVAKPAEATAKVVENSAKTGDFTIMVPAVDFSINCTHNGKTVDVSRFNSYVERTVAIPEGVDPKKITTGIVVSADGKTHHVPTQVMQINGKYYAKINSLTNSTYAVVWHPVTFGDVENHWAKDAVNDMGSRMVVTGVGNGNYNPSSDITRAEFAAIVVRALGLEAGTGETKFNDVKATDWFCGYVETANQYGIIKGYNETTFAPTDKITREQAMAMIARAMKLTGLEGNLTDSEIAALLAGYTDASSAAGYAKTSIAACLKNGVVSGTTSSTVAPKNNITRAEVAAIIQRLLQKSKLI